MNYFMWPYDQCTSGHATFQSKIRCAYICTNLHKIWLHNFPYREILQDWQQGQDFWVEVLMRILGKFSLYFSKFYANFYGFYKFE
jgi:hypothetical protein